MPQQSKRGVDVSLLGRMTVMSVTEKKPKLVFHGADEAHQGRLTRILQHESLTSERKGLK